MFDPDSRGGYVGVGRAIFEREETGGEVQVGCNAVRGSGLP